MRLRNNEKVPDRRRTRDLTRIGLLIALGTVLNLAEIPLPRMIFPWAKPGLANQATLIGIVLLGPAAGLVIAVLRSLLSNLLLGLLFSPGFVLSLIGSVASAGVMGLFFKYGNCVLPFRQETEVSTGLVCRRAGKRFSIISISVVGALVHNSMQLLVAYVLLVQHWGVWLHLPPMIVVGVATGLFNGLMASLLLRVLKDRPLSDSGRD